MGCCHSAKVLPMPVSDTGDGNDDIELDMLKEQLDASLVQSILVLGAANSGKSTIVRQLRQAQAPFLPEEEKEFAAALHRNAVDCMNALIDYAPKCGVELSESDQLIVKDLQEWDEKESPEQKIDRRVPAELGRRMVKLWQSEAIQTVASHRSQFWLLDQCKYYMENLERFCQPQFISNATDKIRACVQTAGVIHTRLSYPPARPPMDLVNTFDITDVGGHRSEREKWIHCFNETDALFFVASLAGYSQVMREDPSVNRMADALELFERTVANPVFADSELVLYLNKKDLFENMLKYQDLSVFDEQYDEGPDTGAAIQFVADLFRSRVPADRDLMVHVIDATAASEVSNSFEKVASLLLEKKRPQQMKLLKKYRSRKREIEGRARGEIVSTQKR